MEFDTWKAEAKLEPRTHRYAGPILAYMSSRRRKGRLLLGRPAASTGAPCAGVRVVCFCREKIVIYMTAAPTPSTPAPSFSASSRRRRPEPHCMSSGDPSSLLRELRRARPVLRWLHEVPSARVHTVRITVTQSLKNLRTTTTRA